MSVETSSAPASVKPVVGPAQHGGKKPGKVDAPAGDATSGFSALMSSLSAPDAVSGSAVDTAQAATDASGNVLGKNGVLAPVATALSAIDLVANATSSSGLPGQSDAAVLSDDISSIVDTNTVVAPVSESQTAINLIASMLAPVTAPMPAGAPAVVQASVASVAQATGLVASANLTSNVLIPVATTLPAGSAAVSQSRPAPASTTTVRLGSEKQVVQDKGEALITVNSGADQLALDRSTQSQVDALLGHRSAAQSQTLSAVQTELREVKAQPASVPLTSGPDVLSALAASGAADLLLRPQDRLGTKSASTHSGAGFEGAFGSATAGTVRAEAAFQVPSTSAVIPDTSIAETVSYWVTHGVQSAELKLDGLGSEPVEVSIKLSGDQAQIDFRTNQPDVRQALEGAVAHLKELLSNQGLQLAGVSVGLTGGDGHRGDGQQPKPGTRQTAFVAGPPTVQSVNRSASLSVGKTLDLFV